jgi:hypothetical protein
MSTWDFETRLRQALQPVDPPADLEPRLEMTLGSLVEMAADELEAWELRAIKDPRNWPRTVLGPAAAVVIGSGVGPRRAHVPRRGARGDARVRRHRSLTLAEHQGGGFGSCSWRLDGAIRRQLATRPIPDAEVPVIRFAA